MVILFALTTIKDFVGTFIAQIICIRYTGVNKYITSTDSSYKEVGIVVYGLFYLKIMMIFRVAHPHFVDMNYRYKYLLSVPTCY